MEEIKALPAPKAKEYKVKKNKARKQVVKKHTEERRLRRIEKERAARPLPESPIPSQPFMWIAEYTNGSELREFNKKGKEGNFYDIDKDRLARFALVGRKTKIGYDTVDGVLQIFGKAYGFFLGEGDKITPITGIKGEVYNDIIQYKGFYADMNFAAPGVQSGPVKAVVNSFHLGWKKTINTPKGLLHFKAVIVIELGVGIRIEMKVTPEFDYNGALILSTNEGTGETFVSENLKKGASDNFVYKIEL